MASLLMSMPATTNKDIGNSPTLSILESHNLATGLSSSTGSILDNTMSPSDTPIQPAFPMPSASTSSSSSSSSSTANAPPSQQERSLPGSSSLASFHRPAYTPSSAASFSTADSLRPVVKLRFGDKIKRIVLPKSEMASLTMAGLKALVKKHFHLEEELSFKFKDTEGDWVLLEDDTDLSNAIAIGPILNVRVINNELESFESIKEIVSSFQPQLESILTMIKELLLAVDKQKSGEKYRNPDISINNAISSSQQTAPAQQASLGHKPQDQAAFPPTGSAPPLQMKGPGAMEHSPQPPSASAPMAFPSHSAPHPPNQKPHASFPYPAPPSAGPTPSGLHLGTQGPHSNMPNSPYPAPPAPSTHFSQSSQPPLQQSQTMQPAKPSMPSSPAQMGGFPGQPQQFGGGPQMMPPPPSGFHASHLPQSTTSMRPGNPQPPPSAPSGPSSTYMGANPSFQQGQPSQFQASNPNPPPSLQGAPLHHHQMASGNQMHQQGAPGPIYSNYPYQNSAQAHQTSPPYR